MKYETELTKLQQIIVAGIIEGQTSKEIANELDLHLATITGERTKIFKKFGFTSTQELIMYFKEDSEKTELISYTNFGLSEAELKVCFLLVNAYTTKQIGEKLCKSPRTIDAQRTSILKKVGVKDKNELLVLAIDNKWFETINLEFNKNVLSILSDKEILFINVVSELNDNDGILEIANNLGFLTGFSDRYKIEMVQEYYKNIMSKLNLDSFDKVIELAKSC